LLWAISYCGCDFKGYFTLFTFGCCSKTHYFQCVFAMSIQSDGQSL
jgi:hypothetical protein